jgi:hypothetical protein
MGPGSRRDEAPAGEPVAGSAGVLQDHRISGQSGPLSVVWFQSAANGRTTSCIQVAPEREICFLLFWTASATEETDDAVPFLATAECPSDGAVSPGSLLDAPSAQLLENLCVSVSLCQNPNLQTELMPHFSLLAD